MFVVSPTPTPPAANGNDTKKFKGDVRSSGVPSRVVHVRKLPNDINEAEVIGLGLPFGKVTNLLMLKGKNQVGTCRFSQQLGGGGSDGGRDHFSNLAPPGSHHNDSFEKRRTAIIPVGIPWRN